MESRTTNHDLLAAHERLQDLLAKAEQTETDTDPVLREALQELATALEEIHVAGEELLQQNEELAESRQLVEAERSRFEELFETAPDGYLVTDETETIRNANRMACALFNRKKEYLTGKPLRVLLANDDKSVLSSLLESLHSGETPPPSGWELQFSPSGAKPFTAAVSVSIHRAPDGVIQEILWLLRDVTEQKAAEHERSQLLVRIEHERRRANTAAAELRRERDLLETVMEKTDTCLAYLDRDFNFVRVNDAYAETSGYSKEELIGRNHFELFPHQENQKIFEQVRDTGVPVEFLAKPFEHPKRRDEGITFWDWTLAPVLDDQGKTHGLVFTLFDVTETKKAERERERYLHRLQRMIRVSRDVMTESTVPHLLEHVVDAACDLTEATSGVSGNHYENQRFQFGALSHRDETVRWPDEENFGIRNSKALYDLFRKKASIRLTGEELHNHPLGKFLPGGKIEVRGLLGVRLVDAAGKPTGFVLVTDKKEGGEFTAEDEALLVQLAALASLSFQHVLAADVARRRAQERAAVFNAMSDATLVFDPEGKPIRANPAARKLLGRDVETATLTETLETLQFRRPGGETLKTKDLPWMRAKEGELIENERLLLETPEGSTRTLLVSAAPVKINDDIRRVVFVSRDVTALERTGRKLRALEERFERAIEEAPFPIMLHAEDGEILTINRAWTDLTGYKPVEIDTIEQLVQRAFPDQQDDLKEHIAQLYDLKTRTRGNEREVVTKSGKKRVWEFSNAPLGATPDGRRMVITIAIDLTERRKAEASLLELKRRLKEEQSFAGIVGRDDKMIELFETIRELSEVDAPVLIQGESGTGKELVAAAIHNEGHRAERPFVPVNCGALPETLLESELFGHVRGAFTGAIRDKRGRFELADRGSIFLDEIGELSPTIQVKLLRVLQEGTFERVGDEKTITVNVRIVSATNKDLLEEVMAGRFREDLYYRLCVIPVNLPPLRERKNDIPLLVAHIMKNVSKDRGIKDLMVSGDAMSALMDYDWPGNIRELQNALYYASVKCKGEVLELHHFPPNIASKSTARRGSKPKARRRKLTTESVMAALKETGGNKTEAARRLDVSRVTLYRFLRQKGIAAESGKKKKT